MVNPVPIGNFIRATFRGRIAGEVTENEFVWWRVQNPALTLDPLVVAADLETQIWTDFWRPLASTKFTLESIHVRVGQIGVSASIGETTRFVNEAGLLGITQALPAFNTVRILKSPDNANIYSDDPLAPLFSRSSYKSGMPGLVEGDQDNGQLIPAAQVSWNLLAQALLTVTTNLLTYSLMVVRGTNTLTVPNAAAWVLVASTGVSINIGSQVSRKM